jgi:hypothetical protein
MQGIKNQTERKNIMEKTFEQQFGFETCYQSVVFDIETLKQNPIELLGKYILRAEQDKWFNKTMIDALKKYIADNNIQWNYKF